MKVIGNIVDVHQKKIFNGEIHIKDGFISQIIPTQGKSNCYLLPGFIDSHIHIESSMLVPSEFARIAVTHGTVATVSDPHEIANVLGMEGVKYMLENGSKVPFKFYFGAPSCVPATTFETAGATISPEDIDRLMADPQILYLAEMMNYPGIINGDPGLMAKIRSALSRGKKVDGHAPGLRGNELEKYIAAGISTDHESFTYEEAREKLEKGMKIIIREGSAARNYEALHPLISEFPGDIMFCSDDKHPDELLIGHINLIVARSIADGHDLYDVLRAASLNPAKHYGLPVGLLREGDPADLIVVKDLTHFNVEETYISGVLVSKGGQSMIPSITVPILNNFRVKSKHPDNLAMRAANTQNEIPIIRAIDKEIVTEKMMGMPKIVNGFLVSDMAKDLLKISVVNRYSVTTPAVAFIHGFGLKSGAIASSVAHDSHNIIAVGTDDGSICRAMNLIIEHRGGISAVNNDRGECLPLPVAGLMSVMDAATVGKAYAALDKMVKEDLGSTLSAPFMTLSFMALLVIPELKLSDLGLFDGGSFSFVK